MISRKRIAELSPGDEFIFPGGTNEGGDKCVVIHIDLKKYEITYEKVRCRGEETNKYVNIFSDDMWVSMYQDKKEPLFNNFMLSKS